MVQKFHGLKVLKSYSLWIYVQTQYQKIYPLVVKEHKALSIYNRPNFRTAKITESFKNWLDGHRRKEILLHVWININIKATTKSSISSDCPINKLPCIKERYCIQTAVVTKILRHIPRWYEVQFSCSVISNSLWPHGLQHARPPCPSPIPRVYSNSCHRVGDAIQLSHLLLSPSPPALNLSQHQGRFQWVSSSHQVAKVLEFQFQHQSFQWTFRTDFF